MTDKKYRVQFLVEAESWSAATEVFRQDLGLSNNKKDSSSINMRNHFIVGLKLPISDLDDEFYRKVTKSRKTSILHDALSSERGLKVLEMILPLESNLREFAAYSYTLAEDYKKRVDRMFNYKKGKKYIELAKKDKHVVEDEPDSLVSKTQFGDLLDFLAQQGNVVETKYSEDATAEILERSKDFDEFKQSYIKRFKQVCIFDIVASAVLENDVRWADIKDDLSRLKSIRDKAAHSNVIISTELEFTQKRVPELLDKLERKQNPSKSEIDDAYRSMSLHFENNAKIISDAMKILSTQYMAEVTQITKGLSKMLETQIPTLTATQVISSQLAEISQQMVPKINLSDQIYKGIMPQLDVFKLQNPYFRESNSTTDVPAQDLETHISERASEDDDDKKTSCEDNEDASAATVMAVRK